MRSSWSSPLVIETPSGPQIVLVSCGGVAAYDPKDGRERWRVLRKQSDVVPAATYAKGLVVAVLSSGGALAIRPDGAGDVTKTHVVWRNEDATAEVASRTARRSFAAARFAPTIPRPAGSCGNSPRSTAASRR
jgi:hypothetical protein